jgi:transaldolase
VAVSATLAGKKHGSGRTHRSLTDGVSAALAANMKQSLPESSRVTVQVDARDAHDTKALVARAQALVAACTEAGLKPATDVLLRIHATYEGVAAAKILEAQGYATLISGVYSLAQGVAAVDAGASVVLVGNR